MHYYAVVSDEPPSPEQQPLPDSSWLFVDEPIPLLHELSGPLAHAGRDPPAQRYRRPRRSLQSRQSGPSSRCLLGWPILAASLPDIRPLAIQVCPVPGCLAADDVSDPQIEGPVFITYPPFVFRPLLVRPPQGIVRGPQRLRAVPTLEARFSVPASESDRPDENAVVR